jgi:hypothetical protein
MTQSAKAFSVALAVVSASLLAACSGGSSSSTGTSANTTTSDAVAGGSTDVCALVPLATAESITGEKFSGAKEQTLAAGQELCTYENVSGPSVMVTVYQSSSGVTMDILKTMYAGAASKDAPVAPLSGIGNQALASAAGIAVKTGNVIFSIEGITDEIFGKYDKDVALGKVILANLH